MGLCLPERKDGQLQQVSIEFVLGLHWAQHEDSQHVLVPPRLQRPCGTERGRFEGLMRTSEFLPIILAQVLSTGRTDSSWRYWTASSRPESSSSKKVRVVESASLPDKTSRI